MLANPPNAKGLPHTLPYICQFAIDMAHVQPPGIHESKKAFRHLLHGILLKMDSAPAGTDEIRITRKCPVIPWQCVWKTLLTAGISDTIKPTWYATIHDIIPTHERLAAINLVPTVTCTSCGEPDTLQHRIANCTEGPVI
jgi:hypothetical protein